MAGRQAPTQTKALVIVLSPIKNQKEHFLCRLPCPLPLPPFSGADASGHDVVVVVKVTLPRADERRGGGGRQGEGVVGGSSLLDS